MAIARLFAEAPTGNPPPAGYVDIFVDTADNHLKQRDSAGTIIDLTAVGLTSVDLGVTLTASGFTVTNTGGNDANVPLADNANAGAAAPGVNDAALSAVQSVQPGTGIIIDASDPQNPIVINNAPGQVIYDGVGDLTSILAIDPSTVAGQTWWAFDVKIAVTSTLDIGGANIWQQVGVQYEGSTDTFKLPATQDGQTQNLGQEVFITVANITATPAVSGVPEVFLSVGTATAGAPFQDVVRPVASDLREGMVFGINTTDIAAGGTGKMTTFGCVADVDTSAWGVNDILFVDPAVPGGLTNIQPDFSAFNVAHVLRVGTTDGIIFVNTVASNRVDAVILPGSNQFLFLTGETDTITAGTFYSALIDDEGSVGTATEVVAVPDNSIVAASQDHITPQLPNGLDISAGQREGQIEYEHDSNGGQERIYYEVYEADVDGNPVDSGIVGQPTGDLGVRPIVVLTTGLLDNDAGDVFKEELRGLLQNDYSIPAGNRLRVHILCEKVGTAGGTKDFTLYFGSNHDSFIKSVIIVPLRFIDLTDTFNSYVGLGGQFLRVKPTEDGVEAVPVAGAGGASIETLPLALATGQTNFPTGQAKAVAFFVSKAGTFSQIQINKVINSTVGSFEVGIYTEDPGTPGDYLRQATAPTLLDAAVNQFTTLTLQNPVNLSVGVHYMVFLIPNTGGSNPSLAHRQDPQSNTRHAWISNEQNLSTLPAVLTIQAAHSEMYWAGLIG